MQSLVDDFADAVRDLANIDHHSTEPEGPRREDTKAKVDLLRENLVRKLYEGVARKDNMIEIDEYGNLSGSCHAIENLFRTMEAR